MWQDTIALSIVTAAIGYLAVRLLVRGRRGQSGCGACSSCPAEEESGVQVVPLAQVTASSSARREVS